MVCICVSLCVLNGETKARAGGVDRYMKKFYKFSFLLYFSFSLILGGSSAYSLALRNVDI